MGPARYADEEVFSADHGLLSNERLMNVSSIKVGRRSDNVVGGDGEDVLKVGMLLDKSHEPPMSVGEVLM